MSRSRHVRVWFARFFSPQPTVISDNKSPFFLFTSHAYSWQFHMCWVSVFIGAGTFSIQNIYTTIYYSYYHPRLRRCYLLLWIWILWAHEGWHQDVETVERHISYWYQRTKRKKKYDKCWHLHFKCHPFLKRVWRDGLRRYSNTEIALCPVRMKRLLILLLSNLLSESPGEENKTSHDMWKTPLCLLSYLKVRK